MENVPDAPDFNADLADGRIRDPAAAELLGHAQRIAEGAALAIRHTTWSYGLVLDAQRDAVLRHRALVLSTVRAVRQLRKSSPERCAEIVEKVGEDGLTRAVRVVVLAHLDQAWSDHLAALDEVREGIHLRALARESPLDEFRKIAAETFDPFFDTVYERAAETLADADVTDSAVVHSGPRRPTSTWTYLVTDDPFGSEADRFLTGVRSAIRRRRG